MDLELLQIGVDRGASDIHITVGVPPVIRVNGELIKLDCDILNPQDTKKLVYEILDEKSIKTLEDDGEVDSVFSIPGIGRFRINSYKQMGNYGMAIRIISDIIPSMKELGLPSIVSDFARLSRGLILVTGVTGCGKSTTLASMIDQINRERSCHILTLEDPIEYVHNHKHSIVNQREIGRDSLSFGNGLRSALRQDPDIILLGEMRDLDSITVGLTAAETGHLVLSTLHTLGAANTIDRIIDVFPPHQQQQIRIQLSSAIKGIISQQLLPRIDKKGGRIAAFEIMKNTTAISNLIREGKIYQINTAIQTGSKFNMQTMDNSIIDLYKKGCISKETAINQSIDSEYVEKYIL